MNTAADLRELIATGECASVEFKSSLRFDLQTGRVNKDLTKVVAKTIAGFLNSEGGSLLIGVDDAGEIVGIEHDIETLSRKNNDYFELTLRNALGKHIGIEVSPEVDVDIIGIDGKNVALVRCEKHEEPVFFQDGDQREFYVRDGNLTRPLHIKAAHNYIAKKFATPPSIATATIADIVTDVLSRAGISPPTDLTGPQTTESLEAGTRLREIAAMAYRIQSATTGLGEIVKSLAVSVQASAGEPNRFEAMPPWLEVATIRVVDLFLRQLAGSVGWKRLYLVSPWISPISATTIQFATFLRRVIEDGTTVYVVTRRPTEAWHWEAVSQLADTARANIAFVENLHAKLYTASTNNGDFALLGSANLTENSLKAHEIGMLVNGFSEGKRVVSQLHREAFKIYRTPGRDLPYRAKFSL